LSWRLSLDQRLGSIRSHHFSLFAGGEKTGFARKNGRISS
jgi:hypothetical protein